MLFFKINDMRTIRKGLIKSATEANTLHDGKLLTGFEIEIVDDKDGPGKGYYIYYNDPKETRGRGYNQWYENLEQVERSIKVDEERGMVIEWYDE